jgi:hypothetical protein
VGREEGVVDEHVGGQFTKPVYTTDALYVRRVCKRSITGVMRIHEDMDMNCTISGRAVNNQYQASNKSTWRTIYYSFSSCIDSKCMSGSYSSVALQPSVPLVS